MRSNRFICFFFLIALWLPATESTKYIGKRKQKKQTNKQNKKTGIFNQGEGLGSPHTGYGPTKSSINMFLLKHVLAAVTFWLLWLTMVKTEITIVR